MKNKLKKIIALGLAAFMSCSLAILPVCAKGGGGARAGSVARPAVTRSVSHSGSISRSPARTPNSGTVKSPPTRTGPNSGKVTPTRSGPNSGKVNSSLPGSYTSVNHYYGNYGSGFSGFMGGFWGGMMAGSLMHPWGMYYPTAGGMMGYTAAPISYMITYLIIDLIIFLIVCVVLFKVFKWFKRRNK